MHDIPEDLLERNQNRSMQGGHQFKLCYHSQHIYQLITALNQRDRQSMYPELLGPPHPFSKVIKEKFETQLTPVEVLIDNEAGNTKSTHLSKTYYLHDIKQQ
jgi:hypothetical protein